jgi:hypothetical protein
MQTLSERSCQPPALRKSVGTSIQQGHACTMIYLCRCYSDDTTSSIGARTDTHTHPFLVKDGHVLKMICNTASVEYLCKHSRSSPTFLETSRSHQSSSSLLHMAHGRACTSFLAETLIKSINFLELRKPYPASQIAHFAKKVTHPRNFFKSL